MPIRMYSRWLLHKRTNLYLHTRRHQHMPIALQKPAQEQPLTPAVRERWGTPAPMYLAHMPRLVDGRRHREWPVVDLAQAESRARDYCARPQHRRISTRSRKRLENEPPPG